MKMYGDCGTIYSIHQTGTLNKKGCQSAEAWSLRETHATHYLVRNSPSDDARRILSSRAVGLAGNKTYSFSPGTYRGHQLQLLAVALLRQHQLFGRPAAFPLPAVPLLLNTGSPEGTGRTRGEAHGHGERHDSADTSRQMH
ncbi:hypothetical protein EYF80_046340 [Liparis tanakae]|uniref:Uncharacterized protein n=1 Tax=Liparis tanakae TaxID=230148 RepID=A0A4Z2FSW4_9TELE|nr:hypothetical protein EYF80_046340 [Liparis tanakae]